MRFFAVATVATLLLAAPAGARPPLERSPDLWATVNICDTEGHPDAIGVRGSMPGFGRRALLQMRFQVQYLAKADGKWHNLADDTADTGFLPMGRTRTKVIEGGHTFQFSPPADGGAHTLRGAVTFRWRRAGRTLARLREVTEGGHRSTTADPPGFSAAICKIS